MREPVDLAEERLRGYVLAASDESLGSRHNLLKPGEPDPGRETWATRRLTDGKHHWAVVRLGVPGTLEELVVDTLHITSAYPPEISVDGCVAAHNALPQELENWTELVARTDIAGDRQNRFRITSKHRFTHLRLNLFPDGEVARLRVYGQPVPNWMAPGFSQDTAMDLAALVNGGHVHSASDSSRGDRQNLIKPGHSQNASQGWLTRRRREPGNDWAVVRLVGPGTVQSVTLDTSNLEHECPTAAGLEATSSLDPNEGDWFELLPPQTMIPNTEHIFQRELKANSDVVWVRLQIVPDGGMARLRVWGRLNPAGLEEARLLYLNSAGAVTLKEIFHQVCHSQRWSEELARLAPYSSLNDLLKKGAGAWSKCSEPDWRDALKGHPRIGQKAKGSDLSAQWSKGEQSSAASPEDGIRETLLQVQEEYFQKFGFIFLICATGKSSAQILQVARERLGNSVPEELQTVAEEQAKIIHLRLEKLLKS